MQAIPYISMHLFVVIINQCHCVINCQNKKSIIWTKI